jgi:hypothetical protein
MHLYSGWLMSSFCGIMLQLDQRFKTLESKFFTPFELNGTAAIEKFMEIRGLMSSLKVNIAGKEVTVF